ncbi:uncharacterized protein LOC101238258 [Hydra vulgaris]|uniref:Uncharacterized protein LOC101238258 n=1 Tax=Hydra vulgaris TaxID=6087 RepID=A0ABM4CHI0_HYDVU
MKAKQRKTVITVLGVFQILFSICLIAIGIWGFIVCPAPVGKTGAVPFWIAGMCLFSGYVAIFFPRNRTNIWIYLLICTCIISCIVSAVVTSWMFVMSLRATNNSDLVFYALVMSFNIFIMLNTAILSIVARIEAEVSFLISPIAMRSTSVINRQPSSINPPPYTNGSFQFGNVDFLQSEPTVDAPPPYEP